MIIGARFIPAGAGNIVTRCCSVSPPTVYPRWRGEHTLSVNPRALMFGLSPLARGTSFVPAHTEYQRRFIPAGAGNMTTCRTIVSWNTVYPRWRGEHRLARFDDEHYYGLSPLARGTWLFAICQKLNYRFIPAGAGNIIRAPLSSRNSTVYPRWRGEHIL
ncbi:Domain of uncharacterised function (DUF2825) [Klebsiella aerogenes]|nr:Domain of uncharacterised function (DUF2825) [Klebsiella aerogenes]